MSKPILQCKQLYKTYVDGAEKIEVLSQVNMQIMPGDRVAIVGPSGSGKSTLMHLLGGLDNPTDGEVNIYDTSWGALKEKERCIMRNKHLGFVYQFHHLLPEFTALENVSMALLLGGMDVEKAEHEAQRILQEVGLSTRIQHKPSQLSGGERQRVAIARALVHRPQCVLADEPTGNLDQGTAAKVFELMLNLNSQLNTALVIVTHDLQLAKRMDRVLMIQEGKLTEQG